MNKELLLKWLYSGSLKNVFREFDNNFVRFNNSFITKVIEDEPEIVYNLLLEKIGNKERNIYLLAKLSNAKNKKLFKTTFRVVIKNINDIYCFLFYIKKIRGFGRIIRESILNWFHYTPTFKLVEYFEKCSYGYKWSFRDVLKEFHIKPKNKTEQELFKTVLNTCVNEETDSLFSLIERYETLKSLKSYEFSKYILIYENSINKILSRLSSNKKISHYIDPCSCYNLSVINSRISMKSLIKHLFNGFSNYTHSSFFNIDGNPINLKSIDFSSKPCKNSLSIINVEEDTDIVFVWSDKRNIKISTNKPVVKIHLNLSRITSKKEEKNVYKILGFNNNTIELIGNIIEGKI